jgi:tRNA pseudouridine55 synthase
MSRSETDGLLLVDKPEGPTSHDVVEAVRRALGGARCGHAGTLDPFASGLLVIGVGKATRLLRFLAGAEKTYEGTIRLGVATDTDDRTGRPLHDPRHAAFGDADLASALEAVTGEFDQLPPGYSARKQGGVPSYRLARRGLEPPRSPSRVRVAWEECRREEPGLLRIRLTVSAGTYIRAIARDLGETLGCGGHLESLRRTASGPLLLQDATPVPQALAAPGRMRRGDPSPPPGEPPPEASVIAARLADLGRALRAALIPPEGIPLGLPSEALSEDEARQVRSGSAIAWKAAAGSPGYVRLLGPEGELVGVAEADAASAGPLLKPRIVL